MYGTQPTGQPDMGIGQAQCQSGLATEPPKRISELQNQVNRLNDNLQYLEKSLGNLASKLQPILAPSTPTGENKSVQEAMNTDVGKLLQQYNNKIEMLTGVINEIGRRLEV